MVLVANRATSTAAARSAARCGQTAGRTSLDSASIRSGTAPRRRRPTAGPGCGPLARPSLAREPGRLARPGRSRQLDRTGPATLYLGSFTSTRPHRHLTAHSSLVTADAEQFVMRDDRIELLGQGELLRAWTRLVDGRLCAQWWAEHLEPVGGRGRLPASDLGLGWVGVGQGTPLSWDADGSVQLFEPPGRARPRNRAGTPWTIRCCLVHSGLGGDGGCHPSCREVADG